MKQIIEALERAIKHMGPSTTFGANEFQAYYNDLTFVKETLAALRAQQEPSREDTAMLDWLDKNGWTITRMPFTDPAFDSLRATIRSAMTTPPAPQAEPQHIALACGPVQIRDGVADHQCERPAVQECGCREALKAYMFMEQTVGGRNPHRPGTNAYRALELARAALERCKGGE